MAPSGSVEAFDQFLDLPHLNVLFCDILRLTHSYDSSKLNLRLYRRGSWPPSVQLEDDDEEREGEDGMGKV